MLSAKKFFITGYTLFFLSQPAMAETVLSSQYSACVAQSTDIADRHQCVHTEINHQEKRLHATLQKAQAQLSHSRNKALQKSQRIWEKYKQAICNFHLDPDAGKMGLLDADTCVMQVTAARAQQLEVLTVAGE